MDPADRPQRGQQWKDGKGRVGTVIELKYGASVIVWEINPEYRIAEELPRQYSVTSFMKLFTHLP